MDFNKLKKISTEVRENESLKVHEEEEARQNVIYQHASYCSPFVVIKLMEKLELKAIEAAKNGKDTVTLYELIYLYECKNCPFEEIEKKGILFDFISKKGYGIYKENRDFYDLLRKKVSQGVEQELKNSTGSSNSSVYIEGIRDNGGRVNLCRDFINIKLTVSW